MDPDKVMVCLIFPCSMGPNPGMLHNSNTPLPHSGHCSRSGCRPRWHQTTGRGQYLNPSREEDHYLPAQVIREVNPFTHLSSDHREKQGTCHCATHLATALQEKPNPELLSQSWTPPNYTQLPGLLGLWIHFSP